MQESLRRFTTGDLLTILKQKMGNNNPSAMPMLWLEVITMRTFGGRMIKEIGTFITLISN
jgi:hypothetical protein